MDAALQVRPVRIRGMGSRDTSPGRRPVSRNKQWTADGGGKGGNITPTPHSTDGERWERGGHRGGRGIRGAPRGRGRTFPNATQHFGPAKQAVAQVPVAVTQDSEWAGGEEREDSAQEEPELETQEEREKYYQELVKEREVERKRAIAEGKMDDPLIPKRLEDAISIVGTCQDMCPRFERYRRERENNLFEWETIPGTKRVDHKRAVKMYERAAGDKILPSDLRPPTVLKRTLDYLFHDLLPRGGFSQTFNFIRDRSRAVRNDFTMQHNTGALAIECHDRCARFHILALHFERDQKGFSAALEEQQLMNTLQSLKEFYEDQRGRYESPTELEMRVYHRLIHIRDQKERHEGVPDNITSHPVFKLTTDFRLNVQRKSAPIGKATPLIVDAEGMEIFAQLASVLREQGSVVMVYLVACILERLFGKETIDDIEAIRGNLGLPDIIDGASSSEHAEAHYDMTDVNDYDEMVTEDEPEPQGPVSDMITPVAPRSEPSSIDSFPATSSLPPSVSSSGSAFSSLQTTPNVFGASTFSLSKTTELSFGHASGFGTSNPTPAVAPIPSTQSATATVFPSPEPRPQPSLKPPTSGAGDRNTSMFGNGNGNISWSSNILAASQAPASQPVTETPPPVSSTLNAGAPSFTPTSHQPTSASQSISTFEPLTSTPVHPSDPSIPSHTITADQPAFTPRQSVTPTLPKIDTTTRTNSISEAKPPTPIQPPPLNKIQPISLPSTPAGSNPVNHLMFLRNNSYFDISTPNSGILSPLSFMSPNSSRTASIENFATIEPKKMVNGNQGPGRLPEPSTPAYSSTNTNDNGKGKERAVDRESLKIQALNFEQKGTNVKHCFHFWHHRAADAAAWVKACKQSEAYREKAQKQRTSLNGPSEKKRRASSGLKLTTESPQKRRARRRVSTEYQMPRSDEELARRFKENHQEHQHRWAQGSFLEVTRTHISTNATAPPLSWHIWLSLNPESDATAIWLERKFDIPASGNWTTNLIFSIPLSTSGKKASSEFPGLLVFECTPLGDVADELERKYRILDDCARLRDIIKSLPARRHFVPSLLVLRWEGESQTHPAPDFFDMIQKHVDDSVLGGFSIFSIASEAQDLDSKLVEALKPLPLDTEGRLVRRLNLTGLFKCFEPHLTSFISEWLENCSTNGDFDWLLFGRLAQTVITLFNKIAGETSQLLFINQSPPFPALNPNDITTSSDAYEAILTWLGAIGAKSILTDLQSHRELGNEFPTNVFFEHLREYTVTKCEGGISQPPQTQFYIPAKELASAMKRFEASKQTEHTSLGQCLAMSVRRSPKRRSVSEETEQIPKRRRISIASSADERSVSNSWVNGPSTPSPTNSTISLPASETPLVTVAMLRALTKNMKQRYTKS